MEDPAVSENEAIEIDLLLEAIYRKHRYDFRDYARASLTRRIRKRMSLSGVETLAGLQHRVIHDPSFFETLLFDLIVHVTEMFRDPPFFRALRETVLPGLVSKSHIKIWHAGCATGEEAYSLAILLLEAGRYEDCRIYATDVNAAVLEAARTGVYPASIMRNYTQNYQQAGGAADFSDYYTCRYDHAILSPALRKNIVFAHHNLSSDGVFGEMNLILCRNVLIYFNSRLQDRAIGLFLDSLSSGGFLCLGIRETPWFSVHRDSLEAVAEHQGIYRKK